MSTLTAADFTSGRGLKHEDVELPSLGGIAHVYELSPRQRVAFIRWIGTLTAGYAGGAVSAEMLQQVENSTLSHVDVETFPEYNDRLLAYTLRDDEAQLIFPDPAKTLTRLSDSLSEDEITALVSIAQRLSGLTNEAIEEKADELPNSLDASAS